MKKISRKARERDVLQAIRNRRKSVRYKRSGGRSNDNLRNANNWILEHELEGVNVIFSGRKVTLVLPEEMNFSEEYELTTKNIIAIRKLTKRSLRLTKKFYLTSVRFDNLKSISTPAALVLTAELSRWDDIINQNLRPQLQTWSPIIINRFAELGFFELFKKAPKIESEEHTDGLKLVKYIKGKCGDKNKTKELKKSLQKLIGEKVPKWPFMHSGLSEAITNVSHHAYPANIGVNRNDKNWYLTGSLNKDLNILKIAFYDQGIGIPKSLPTSKIWEKILKLISSISQDERKLHTTLLKAAVEIDRTSTEVNDRGKGLQDLLEFIKQRGDGYLSILSLKGLYKYSIINGEEKVKTFPFGTELPGTLIIWSVKLQSNQ